MFRGRLIHPQHLAGECNAPARSTHFHQVPRAPPIQGMQQGVCQVVFNSSRRGFSFLACAHVQRMKELDDTVAEMATTAFGGTEKLAEMYEIETMMVAPEKQRRGYATALMNLALEKVC